MCGWTKKRCSMKAVVPMATRCPKSLHGKREKWIAQHFEVFVYFSMMMMFISLLYLLETKA